MAHRSRHTIAVFLYILAIAFTSAVLFGQEEPTAKPGGTQTAAAPSASSKLQLREELIGELSPGSKLQIARSTDNHLAWVEKNRGTCVVKLDGKQVGATYDDVDFLRFSKDEQHLAFAAKRNSKWVLVLDGQERSKEYGRLTSPAFSANGKFFAVSGCVEKKCRLIVNGDEVASEFQDISPPAFTSSGEHYGYFAKRTKKWVLMLDGKEYGPEMDDFAGWRLGPDAKRVAVAGLINGNWTWVVDGTPGPGFDVISDIAFNSDLSHYAYGGTNAKWGLSKHKTRGVMAMDGKVAGEYEGRGFGGGWQGMFGTSTEIVTGVRRLSPDFHGVSDPQYTPEGKLVYAARRGENDVVVVVDGTPGPTFEDIVSPIAISSDGKHVAYVVKRGDAFVEVRDHKPGASFPGKRAESLVGSLSISDDGEHLIYEIIRGGSMFKEGRTDRALRRIIIDGQAGPEYDALGIRDVDFRPNARSYHYVVVGAKRGFNPPDLVVFNGRETKLYTNVFGGSVKFIDDQTIEFVAQDDQRFLRVTALLQ